MHSALCGELTIFTANEKRDALLSVFASAGPLELDLSQVNEVDACGLQLLIALKNEARVQKRELVFTNHSPALLEVIDLCNLGQFFGDPLLIQKEAHV